VGDDPTGTPDVQTCTLAAEQAHTQGKIHLKEAAAVLERDAPGR